MNGVGGHFPDEARSVVLLDKEGGAESEDREYGTGGESCTESMAQSCTEQVDKRGRL